MFSAPRRAPPPATVQGTAARSPVVALALAFAREDAMMRQRSGYFVTVKGSPVARQIVLRAVGADGRARTLRFEGYSRITLGSASDCDVVLRDGAIQPRHATLLVEDAGLRIADCGDAGTWIEGRPLVGEALLLPGERLSLGGHTVVVQPSDRDTTRPRRREAASEVAALGRYELLESLGRGGMAEVFLAEDRTTRRYVALKCILPALADDESIRQMFRDEGRLAAQLDHPMLCRVHEVGSLGGRLYIAMEHIDGADLRRIQARRRRLHPELAVSIVCAVCEGLQYAHDLLGEDGAKLEIVHRNVVPSNVMIGRDGAVKLLDFGIARARLRQTETPTGVLKGVLSYLAPEMVRGEPFDNRVDIFAAGVLLYELVTGVQAFARQTAMATLEAIRQSDLVPLLQLAPQLPVALGRALDDALAADPDERYGSAAMLREALFEALPASRLVSPAERGALVAPPR